MHNRGFVQYRSSPLRESAVIESTGNLPDNPIKSLEKVESGYRAAGDDAPLMGLDSWEIQRLVKEGKPGSDKRALRRAGRTTGLLYLLVRHGALYVLLVGENKQGRARQSLKETRQSHSLHRMSQKE